MEYGPMEILMAFVALGATIAIIALAAWGIHVWERRMNERGQQGSASGAVVGVLAILAPVKADEEMLKRTAEIAAENERLEKAMAEAKRTDPAKGQTEVGPVQQSYFDNLPTKKKGD